MDDGDGSTCRRRRDKLSKFIESFPTKQLDSMESILYRNRRVFWSQINSSSSSAAAAAADDVKKKVISAFSNVNLPRIKGLLQFWAPLDQGLLSTFDQPFALDNFDPALKSYRLSCLDYQYYYGDDDKEMIYVHGGLIASAFVKGFPDIVFDLRDHKGTANPLVDVALDCGLTCSILIPVFYHSSSCVGVVECCVKVHGLLQIFKELKLALESVGLCTYNVRECLPYETMHGLQRALYETQDALQIVCESLDLSAAQVWIPFRQNENHVPFPCTTTTSSSCMETTTTSGEAGGFAVKFCGYCIDYEDDDIKTYYNTCDVFPLKIDVGLVGKTLETHKTYFCINLRNLRLKGLFGLLSRNTESTCLTICMRSIHTGDDVDYAFEFLWPKSRDFMILMKSLFLTLKKCLPCFEFVQQQQLTDHVRVLLVDDSSLNEDGFIDISQEENKTLHLQPPPKVASAALEQGTKVVKRKFIDHEIEIESDSDSEYWGEADDDVHVIADCGGIPKMFTLQSTYTLEDANDKVEEAFKLDPGTYSLECQLNEKETILNTDQDLSTCIKLWRSLQKTSGRKSHFKVLVKLESQHQLPQQYDASLLSAIAILQKSIQEEEERQQRVQKPFESNFSRRVFWSQFECKSSSDAAAAAGWVIHEKIKHVFTSANVFPVKGIIIQFWAPIMSTDGRWLLSTYDQPFAVSMLNTHIRRYRLSCLKYQYSIVHQQQEEIVEKGDHLPDHMVIINGGPHDTAFLNGFPEVVVDMVHNKWKGNQLLDLALKYDLTCSFMLPVYNQGSTSCVGVIECSMRRSSGLLVMFNELKRELEKVGLSIYHVNKESSPPPPPYTTMSGLKPAVDEIEVALKMVVESHHLTLGQAWIPFLSSSPPCASSMVVDDMNDPEGMFLFKLNGYSVDYSDDPLSCVKDFYDTFNVLPLRKGEGLAGKTLETYRPHLSTRNYLANLTGDNCGGLLSLLSANTTHHHTCLVICLRSVHTGDDVDYVFEFLWPTNRNYLILVNSMLLTLKRFLPSFVFSSSSSSVDGVVVLDDVTTGGFGRLSSPTHKKRKLSIERDLLLTTNSHDDDNDEDDDDDDLVIAACYMKKLTLILLSSSSFTLANLKEKINKDFKLDSNYTLHYQLDGVVNAHTRRRFYPLDDHESFESCLRVWKSVKKKNKMSRINLCVLPCLTDN